MPFFILLIIASAVVPISAADTQLKVCENANWQFPSSRQESLILELASPFYEPNEWPLNFSCKISLSPEAAVKKPIIVAETEKNGDAGVASLHDLCAEVLSSYVDKNGLVDYKTLRRKRLSLIAVLSEYAALDPAEYNLWSENDKLAFWINAYNMCVLKAVIDNYPIQPSRFMVIFYPPNSIMQISNFWKKVDYVIMGEKYSLEEIEKKILRNQFVEPRLCFALSYASLGCAPLREEPYYGIKLDRQLDDQAKKFLAGSQGMKIDREARVVSLPAIVQWYENEFLLKYPPEGKFADQKPAEAAILAYIAKQIPQKDADWLERKIFTIQYVRYNWTLNEQP